MHDLVKRPDARRVRDGRHRPYRANIFVKPEPSLQLIHFLVQSRKGDHMLAEIPTTVKEAQRGVIFDAAIASLNIISMSVADDNDPFVRTCSYRPLANTLRWGWSCASDATARQRK